MFIAVETFLRHKYNKPHISDKRDKRKKHKKRKKRKKHKKPDKPEQHKKPRTSDKHKRRDYVYLSIATPTEFLGKIIIELFTDIAPHTCENFKVLCSNKNIRQSYVGSKFHRSVPGFVMQGGKLEGGPYSIYGDSFPDENFELKHDQKGLLSMANHGPDTNCSQFFITLNKAEHLDGKHVVFGRVIRGFDIVERMARIRTDHQDKPTTDIIIKKCGLYQNH